MAKFVTGRYSIEVRDDDKGTVVVRVGADWTDEDLRAAIAQIKRLTQTGQSTSTTDPREIKR